MHTDEIEMQRQGSVSLGTINVIMGAALFLLLGAHPWQGGTELAATAITFLYLHTCASNALLMSL